jgi:hypothetical protein
MGTMTCLTGRFINRVLYLFIISKEGIIITVHNHFKTGLLRAKYVSIPVIQNLVFLPLKIIVA